MVMLDPEVRALMAGLELLDEAAERRDLARAIAHAAASNVYRGVDWGYEDEARGRDLYDTLVREVERVLAERAREGDPWKRDLVQHVSEAVADELYVYGGRGIYRDLEEAVREVLAERSAS